ncbi:Glu/Leu/Phe/Val family dehydrogenase [Streptosporangium sp. NPDC004631]
MSVFGRMAGSGYEQVVFGHDEETGLRSIIVIHDTSLGPALGGVRMHPYDSEDAALEDCLRLARGMTFKAAVAGLHLGGGKSVIIGDPRTQKTEALLRAHGRLIQTLGGRYIPGIDIGTDQADMDVLAHEVATVSCDGEDPSPQTALGVLEAIRAGVRAAFGTDVLSGVRVAVQGVGHVGGALARLLSAEGARLLIADVDETRAAALAEELGAEVVDVADVASVSCDVYAPCAFGGVVNETTLSGLRCRVVAGAANNVLSHDRLAERLRDLGVVYVPDYLANAGGLVFLEEELLGHSRAEREKRIRGIYHLATRVVEESNRRGVSTVVAADAIVRERLAAARSAGAAQVAVWRTP